MNDPAESYRRDNLSPTVRFDEVETTVSHLFRRPHRALGGRTFGGALYAALASRGFFSADRVLEVGGGTGFVGAAMVAAAKGENRRLRWSWVDLSWPLLTAQRRQFPGAAVQAHAERLPFRDQSVSGCVIANEVIADFRALPSGSTESTQLRAAYGLSLQSLTNVGAIHFLEELARVMAPGSQACLTEFGGDFAAQPVVLEGGLGRGRHVEHSIHFGHLEEVAHRLGFTVERMLLADLLGVDRAVRVASYLDLRRLRRLVPALPIIAFEKAELERQHPFITRVFRFEFPTIGSPRFPDPQAQAGFCQLFQALLLRR